MDCNEVRPVLLSYVMEEVAVADRSGIAEHLANCTACSEEVGKLRQTLGVLVQGAVFEDVPQKIRIVAEPTSRWWSWEPVFWLAPVRLAFAGGALACLAIALLALTRTTISYQDGNFEIAFGAAAVTDQSPTAAPAPTPTMAAMNVVPAAEAKGLSRQQVLALISQAIADSEARQSASTGRLIQTSLKASEAQAEINRTNDRRELAEGFRYIQAAQVNMWKQQVENQQVVSTLLQRTGAEVPPRP